MKKLAVSLLGAFFLTGLLVVPSMAKGPSKQAGASNIGHLYLYEKAPVDGEGSWMIVEGGMWGKMKYKLSGPTFDFVFNGHGLPVSQPYTLIYYPDPWPGDGLICLGSGVTTESVVCNGDADCVPYQGGNVHIKGSVNTGSLPIEADENKEYGAKIFLVPSADVDCDGRKMIGWTGNDANLYEDVLINFEDTDEQPVTEEESIKGN